MNTTFRHLYECDEPDEWPGSDVDRRYYYPAMSSDGGRDGLLVRVCPVGASPWLGIFAFGHYGRSVITGIFSTPDPVCVCVVADGKAYWVNVTEPTLYEVVDAVPVVDVRPIKTLDMIVFATHTSITAYGRPGKKWKTTRIAWDDLAIVDVTDKTIVGTYFDPTNANVRGKFVVDLQTGSHKSGYVDISHLSSDEHG